MTREPKFLPLIAVTHDAGASWNYPQSIVTNLPVELLEYDGNSLKSLFCNSDVCVAVGSAWSYKKPIIPLIAVSKDQGITWSYISNGLNKTAKLNNVKCQDALCFASGEYYSLEDTKLPYLVVSEDGGKTWAMPPSVISALPKEIQSGSFVANTLRSPLKKKRTKEDQLQINLTNHQ